MNRGQSFCWVKAALPRMCNPRRLPFATPTPLPRPRSPQPPPAARAADSITGVWSDIGTRIASASWPAALCCWPAQTRSAWRRPRRPPVLGPAGPNTRAPTGARPTSTHIRKTAQRPAQALGTDVSSEGVCFSTAKRSWLIQPRVRSGPEIVQPGAGCLVVTCSYSPARNGMHLPNHNNRKPL